MHLTFEAAVAPVRRERQASFHAAPEGELCQQSRKERHVLPMRVPAVRAQANRYTCAARRNIRGENLNSMRAQVGGHRVSPFVPLEPA